MMRCAMGWWILAGWGLVVMEGLAGSGPALGSTGLGSAAWQPARVLAHGQTFGSRGSNEVRPQRRNTGGELTLDLGHPTARFVGDIAVVCLVLPGPQDGQRSKPYRRALPPQFDPQRVERTFFEDVFSRTVGTPPKAAAGATTPVSPAAPPADAPSASSPTGPATGAAPVISATTLEDEVKALKLDIDKIVTTPAAFAGSGHKEARVRFALLALLFEAIAAQDGEVRWKNDAPAASAAFARIAANLKAGGSTQVYNEAKTRKQDLADLVSGARFPDASAADTKDPISVDRVPLMQVLEQRLEANLKSWTASDGEFNAHVEQVGHEAELTALIGHVLARPGSEDADDDDYLKFAQLLKQGAVAAVSAARQKDPEAARKAVTEISRSCTDCHENYR